MLGVDVADPDRTCDDVSVGVTPWLGVRLRLCVWQSPTQMRSASCEPDNEELGVLRVCLGGALLMHGVCEGPTEPL